MNFPDKDGENASRALSENNSPKELISVHSEVGDIREQTVQDIDTVTVTDPQLQVLLGAIKGIGEKLDRAASPREISPQVTTSPEEIERSVKISMLQDMYAHAMERHAEWMGILEMLREEVAQFPFPKGFVEMLYRLGTRVLDCEPIFNQFEAIQRRLVFIQKEILALRSEYSHRDMRNLTVELSLLIDARLSYINILTEAMHFRAISLRQDFLETLADRLKNIAGYPFVVLDRKREVIKVRRSLELQEYGVPVDVPLQIGFGTLFINGLTANPPKGLDFYL